MNNLNKFTLAASALFSVVACQKVNSVEPQQPKAETSQTNQASYGDYTVARGRMVFSDTTAFRKMTDYLNSNKNELAAWDEQNGITSMEETYSSINNRLHELDLRYDSMSDAEQLGLAKEASVSQRVEMGTILWIPDRVFASILNANGEFQIGDEIHVITQKQEYVVKADKESVVQSKDWKNPVVQSIPVQYIVPTDKQTANRTGNFTMWYTFARERDVNGNTLPKTWNSRPTRLLASQWNVVWGPYASHGVRSQFEYKSRFAGWLDNDCSEISVSGQSCIIRPSDNSRTRVYVSNADKKYNDDVVEATLKSHLSVLFMEIVYSNSVHRAVYKGAAVEIGL